MLKAGSIVIFLLALMSIGLGIIYCASGDIMAYHQEFIGMTVEEVKEINENLGELLLVFMVVIGSSFIAFGIFAATLVFKGLWKRERWAWWSMLIASSALNVPLIIVTQKVGGTPVLISTVAFVVFLIAMGVAAVEVFRKQAVQVR